MQLTCNLDLAAGDGLNVSITLHPAPVATGGLADLTLTEGVAMTPVDISADFNAVPGSIALTGGTLPAGLTFDGTTLSGTPSAVTSTATLTFTKTNNGGSDSTAFQVTVQAAPAVIDMTDLVYTPPADPAPASLAAEYTTDVVGDIVLFGVTSASATPPPQSEIIAGTGATILEAFNGVLSGGDLLLANALTAASNPATHIHALLRSSDGSTVSVTLSEAVTINITGAGPAFEYLFTAASDANLSDQTEFTNIAGSAGVHRIDAATDQLHTTLVGSAACHDNIDPAFYTVPNNVKVSMDFLARTGSGQSLTGLVGRSSSSTTGYIFHVDPEQNGGAGMIRVLRLSDYGAVIDTTFTAAGVSLPFKGSLVMNDDAISVEIDDVQVASGTDATFTSGQAGVYTLYLEGTAVQPMDNLTVEEL